MSRSKQFRVASAAIAGALVCSAGTVRAADPTPEELRQQIEQLQTKVQQLEARQQAATTAADVNTTMEKVLADANKRNQLLQQDMGFTAGWSKEKGFVIQDAQGNFVLKPTFEFQVRNTSTWRQSTDVRTAGVITGYNGEDDFENGFEVRRMKFGFAGNAFAPNLSYYFLWSTGSTTGTPTLEQAWSKYAFENSDWAIRLGQITNPVIHEQNTSSRRQLTAERSFTNIAVTGFNPATGTTSNSGESFTQAITGIYQPKKLPIWVEFGVGDGFSSQNGNFLDPGEGGSANFDVFGRINWFILGNDARSEYDDFSAINNKSDLLVVGGGVDMTEIGDTNQYIHTADVQWETTFGLSVYGAVLGNYVDTTAVGGDQYNWGAMAQAGFMLNPKWEIFGRGGYIRFDAPASGDANETFGELTFGVNWYLWQSHGAKVTIDGTWLPTGAPEDFPGLGILASNDPELILRAQFQLLL